MTVFGFRSSLFAFRFSLFAFSVALIAFFLITCPSSNNQKTIIFLATTTSVQDTGFLDAVLPVFETRSHYKVKVIAVGSGEAMALASWGQVDLLITHSPELEDEFIKDGFGLFRKPLMFNYFVIAGPGDDPAGIRDTSRAEDAFRKIYQGRFRFVSRSDNSGTHNREMAIWEKAQIKPDYKDYLQTGQGMAETLTISSERAAYILSDKATFLSLSKHLKLTILFEGNKNLVNEYSVIELNHKRLSQINEKGARLLSDFLFSDEVKNIIKTFGVDRFGEPLFFLPSG